MLLISVFLMEMNMILVSIEDYRDIINARAKNGWRYVGYLPTRQRGTGHVQELDLIFEKEES